MSALDPAPSPRFSFRGWLFAVWLFKNKTFVKNVLVAAVALATVLLTGAGETALRDAIIAGGTALATLLGKLAVDAFDYFVTENPR